MNKNVLGWLKIIGGGGSAAGAVVGGVVAAGGPVTWVVGLVAGLAFLASAGSTASALYQEAPKATPPTP